MVGVMAVFVGVTGFGVVPPVGPLADAVERAPGV